MTSMMNLNQRTISKFKYLKRFKFIGTLMCLKKKRKQRDFHVKGNFTLRNVEQKEPLKIELLVDGFAKNVLSLDFVRFASKYQSG